MIDEGNTRAKAALFISNGIHRIETSERANEALLAQFDGLKPDKIIISSVRREDAQIRNFWNNLAPTLWLNHHTPLPITNHYKTPETLGKDRLAGLVGGRFLIPDGHILVIDAGTCITYDVLTEQNEYFGGSISPGASLRYKSLNHFTASLPLVNQFETDHLFGTNTKEAIASGVINGLAHEINGTIEAMEKLYNPLQVVLCGGEAGYFVNKIKKKIFANQNLVLLGLHKILQFNELS